MSKAFYRTRESRAAPPVEARARSAPLHYGGLIGQNLYDLGVAPGFPLTPGVCAALHAATHAVGLRGLP